MGDYLMQFEIDYFNSIKDNCELIFDVGIGGFSIFFDLPNLNVHYFEPFSLSFEDLKNQTITNKKFYLNNFGLSDSEGILPLYSEGSLFKRIMSNKIIDHCTVKKGIDYCIENKISKIDFLKIDVEGMETKVLNGFGDFLSNVRYIQFEYGIGLRDAGSNLGEIMNLLKKYGFDNFSKNGLEKINSTRDFWEWCNITCENKNFIK